MKVKLLVSRAGADFVQNAGDVIDVSDKEGDSLIRAGQAEPVARKTETATKKKETIKR